MNQRAAGPLSAATAMGAPGAGATPGFAARAAAPSLRGEDIVGRGIPTMALAPEESEPVALAELLAGGPISDEAFAAAFTPLELDFFRRADELYLVPAAFERGDDGRSDDFEHDRN